MKDANSEPPILVELEELDRLAAPVRLVDSRSGPDYRRGHLPGAVNLDTFFYANERTDRKGWPKAVDDWRSFFGSVGIQFDETVVFYDGGLENRAPRNSFMLRYLGHPRAHVLNGGLSAWLKAGRPLSKATIQLTPVSPKSYPQAGLREQMIASIEEVIAALGQKDVILVDVREQTEYDGRVRLQQNPRMGRIPGARSVVWTDLLRKDASTPKLAGTPYSKEGMRVGFIPEDQVRRRLAAVGVVPASNVIIYCQKSHRATNVFAIMQRFGFEKIRVYPGSFREWSRRNDLPVER
jgi:thiosulfate/3-mercaptopyruvate sulfurtransferase